MTQVTMDSFSAAGGRDSDGDVPGPTARVNPNVRRGRRTTPALSRARLASLVVETCSLDGGRRHLSEVDESGLVVHGEACALLVEELDRA